MSAPSETDFLALDDVLELHEGMINAIGGSHGVLDLGAVESALAQPRMTFGGEDFYPTLAEKAAALAFSLIKNHAFRDGNKRVGHAAMRLFLDLNGHTFVCGTDEQEAVIKSLAASETSREDFTEWVVAHVQQSKTSMNCPDEIADILLQIIQNGILKARCGWRDGERAAIEADHIHNLPSLLRDYKPELLTFYWRVERTCYLSQRQIKNAPEFDALWKQLEPFIPKEI